MQGEELGRRLIAEIRTEGGGLSDESVTQVLSLGGEGVDDQTPWLAVMTAVHLAVDDGERWLLGDGVIDETIGMRPYLAGRWKAAYRTDEAVRAVHRAMWEDLDGMGTDRGGRWTTLDCRSARCTWGRVLCDQSFHRLPHTGLSWRCSAVGCRVSGRVHIGLRHFGAYR